jgi:hypothetical protein
LSRVRVVRASDLLVCDLELVGIDVVGVAPDRLLSPVAGASPAIIVHLPPQHVAERVFAEGEGLPHDARVVVPARVAGPSRVAFRLDPAVFPIEYRLEAILTALTASELTVPPSAARGPGPGGCLSAFGLLAYLLNPPGLAAPAPEQTAIELPYRLVLSPEAEAGFDHRPVPVKGVNSTRTELWHSLLRPAADREGQRQVRAIWLRRGEGPDWNPNDPKWGLNADEGDHEPFDLNTMSQRDRADIVHVSGNRRYALQTGSTYDPVPVAVRRMALTALGAWFDARGDWDPPKAITSLVEWTHRATQGRDHFVRIVRVGFLYPFGHVAVKIKVSERKFVEREPPGGDPPVLHQRQFIVVRQPLKLFERSAAPPGQAHTMPLRSVRLRTLVTPDVEPTGNCGLVTEIGHAEPFPFKLIATDFEGNSVDLETPLVWIDSTHGWDTGTINTARGLYGAPDLDARGASVAFAPGQSGDTTYPSRSLAFTAPPQDPMPPAPTSSPADNQPGFWPQLAAAEVSAPALEIVAGQNGTARIEYHPAFVANGLGGANLNEVIAQFAGPPLGVDFSDKGDRGGGLLQPSMSVAGLSRQLGPVGGPTAKIADLAAGKFDPKDFFAGAAPKLFGVFTLDQVLGVITGTRAEDVPRIVTEQVGDSLVARQVWNPVPVSYPTTDPIFVVDAATTMELAATFDARSTTPTSDVRATMQNFRVHLMGNPTFLRLVFDKVEFSARTASKPDVDVQLGKVEFAGPLSFVEELKSLIPLDGFSDPPALDITPEGVRSSFSLSLPDLAVGVFSLENLSLSAGFAIPFTDGALTVDFAFCKREEPFLLTVSLFGGGGFFGLALDPNGVQQLEASLEFGASCAINLGVAQGGVHVMAGIYFKIESAKGCTLTGYLRLGGNMSVLGLISASIELNLSFTYKDPGKAYGRAVVTVEIDIFLFSVSVEVECERQFAGSNSDPAFEELMAPDPWHEYCAAYA